ncbi:MAG: nucleotide pyrophosphohydrolase [Saprospiraceae bacterium]
MNNQQQVVDEWISKLGVRYFNELTNLGQLVEEVGELSRLLIRTYGEQSWKENEKPVDLKEKISDELSDILFVVNCLANQMNIDLDVAFVRNLEKKSKRDLTRHLNNPKL